MSLERIRLLVRRFRERLAPLSKSEPAGDCEPHVARDLLESMLLARHLDVAAHELRARGHGHYTIASAGHEANVVLGRLTSPDDPALVHYRSAAFQLERGRSCSGMDVVEAIALSLVVSSDDPVSGGRHKVFGGRELGILPQTSTIASHLPRAVGIAFGLSRRERLELDTARARSICVVSFGDASVNHSTALGALNAASYTAHQNLELPLLFVCEDNGLGISVRSPKGWIEQRLRSLPHVEYFRAPGFHAADTLAAARAAVDYCRTRRRPAVLHIQCVRLLGHAGSDVDTSYRSPDEIESAIERDPVLVTAATWIRTGVLERDEVLALDRDAERRVQQAAERALSRPKLSSRAEIAAPLRIPDAAWASDAPDLVSGGADAAERLTLAQGINRALEAAFARHPGMLLFGEDVAKKGGVYGVTKGLFDKAGPARVFNTLLDEQTILGMALGMASTGLLPVPEIQYLAYLHNAVDQLRGEAATLPFFSAGAFDNPMVVRIAGLGYQEGFGGHFHNENAVAALRDIPGLIVAVPARADDALALYAAAFDLAERHRRVVVVLEPIALYHQKDLHAPGDLEWLTAAAPIAPRLGAPRIYDVSDPQLTIATYGNGVHLSLRAARTLAAEHGIRARVVDIRWLCPLPVDAILDAASATGRLLFVDECRKTGSPSEELAAALLDRRAPLTFARVTSADCLIPLGDAAKIVLLSEREIVEGAVGLVRG